MSPINKFAFLSIMIAALVAFVSSILFGWTMFLDKMGGAKSLAGLIALILLVLFVIGGFAYLMARVYFADDGTMDKAPFIRDLTIASLVFFILAGIGKTWLDLPTGAGMKVLGCLALVALVSAVGVGVCRKPEPSR